MLGAHNLGENWPICYKSSSSLVWNKDYISALSNELLKKSSHSSSSMGISIFIFNLGNLQSINLKNISIIIRITKYQILSNKLVNKYFISQKEAILSNVN